MKRKTKYKKWIERCINNHPVSLLILVAILTPIAINYLLLTWHFPYVYGKISDWMGFLSNYSGGIIGGIVAYIIAKIQIENEKQERMKDEFEKEKFAHAIVENFIYEELKRNLEKIPPQVIKALKEQSEGKLSYTYLWGNKSFIYDNFNEVKLELIKYNTKIVRETIEIYKMLKSFDNQNEINKIKKEDAKIFYQLFEDWKNRLCI